jgi:hypothetical protein
MRMTESGSARRQLILLTVLCAARSVFAQPGSGIGQRFPDVVAVKVRASGPNLFDFDVTISSPYDTPRRYADGFRVYTIANQVLGERKLLHDHQNEQPFTRDLYAVAVPEGLRVVLVQARDQEHGYGGKVVEVALPGR